MSTPSIRIGRFLLGLYFLLPGVMKVTAPEETIAYMQSHGVLFAEPLMWFAAFTNIIGGLLLMGGRHVKLVAFGFVAYILLVNFLLHPFWSVSEEMTAHETQNFIKNLGIMAGLLVMAGYAPNRMPSLSNWWRSDHAMTKL